VKIGSNFEGKVFWRQNLAENKRRKMGKMRIYNKFFLIALALILWLIPLPYGGVEEWSIFALEVATFILFLVFLLVRFSADRRSAHPANPVRVARSVHNAHAENPASSAHLSSSAPFAPQANFALQTHPPQPTHQIHPINPTRQPSSAYLAQPAYAAYQVHSAHPSHSTYQVHPASQVHRAYKPRLPHSAQPAHPEHLRHIGQPAHLGHPEPPAHPAPQVHPSGPVSEASGQERTLGSKIIFSLILLFLTINLLQLTPLPASLIKVFSPGKYQLVTQALTITGGTEKGQASPASLPAFLPLSIAPSLSYYEFLKYLCFFLFAFMLYRSLHSRREVQWLVVVLVSAGIFQAVYGLIEYLSGTGRIFGYKNIWGQGSAFGTFINRDHYAGFLEMIFPLSLGFLLARSNFFALKKGVSWRQKIIWFGQERLQQAILFGTLSVVIGLGLFFSRSRSGVIIFFLIFFLMMLALSLGAKGAQKEAQKVKREKGHGPAHLKPSGREDRKEGEEQRNGREMNEGKNGGGKNSGGESNEDEKSEGWGNEARGNKRAKSKWKRNEDEGNEGERSKGEKNGSERNKRESHVNEKDEYEWDKGGSSKDEENGYERNGGERSEGEGNGDAWNEEESWRSERKRNEASRKSAGKSAKKSGRGGTLRDPGSRRWLRVIRTVTLAVIFVAIFIGIRPIIERFTLESLWREARPKFYGLTLRLIADYPLFGTGAGTYIYAYTPYEEEDLGGILHHAHNDYLETLAEMGILGGGAIICAAFIALAILFWRWLRLAEHDYFGRGVGLGLMGGIVAILIHSFSDFNLRLPANALYFISFYVLAWRLLVARRGEP